MEGMLSREEDSHQSVKGTLPETLKIKHRVTVGSRNFIPRYRPKELKTCAQTETGTQRRRKKIFYWFAESAFSLGHFGQTREEGHLVLS